MHVAHHLPPAPELNTRLQTRKTPGDDEESKAYAHLSGLSEEDRRKGSKGQPPPQRDPDQPPQPTSSGLLRPKSRPLAFAKPAPFMAVTSVTEFWTELVMASKDEGLDDGGQQPAKQAARTNEPSLLDLFAKAVK
ncbi:MAG: hypothetical protein ABSA13_00035 [Beijerinckiaceae bacterium]|jgi:hypothetical protein